MRVINVQNGQIPAASTFASSKTAKTSHIQKVVQASKLKERSARSSQLPTAKALLSAETPATPASRHSATRAKSTRRSAAATAVTLRLLLFQDFSCFLLLSCIKNRF